MRSQATRLTPEVLRHVSLFFPPKIVVHPSDGKTLCAKALLEDGTRTLPPAGLELAMGRGGAPFDVHVLGVKGHLALHADVGRLVKPPAHGDRVGSFERLSQLAVLQ